ncbi:SET and MYND domain-containing protein 3 [Chytridiales sp. JEL 0842]|nr:SET and MYND domain-containing protein 3 [Chytridiales sp. JEL 0842]
MSTPPQPGPRSEELLTSRPSLARYLSTINLKLHRPPNSTHRILTTTSPIPKGHLVLSNEAIAFLPPSSTNSQDLVPCHYCLHLFPPESLKRCSKCKRAQYCGGVCHAKDWSERGHKLICKMRSNGTWNKIVRETLVRPIPLPPDQLDMRMQKLEGLVEIVIKLQFYLSAHLEESSDQSNGTTTTATAPSAQLLAETFLCLCTQRDHYLKNSADEVPCMQKVMDLLLPQLPCVPIPSQRSADLLIYIWKFLNNAYSFTPPVATSLMGPNLGECLYPLGGLVNHSCRPNVVAIYLGRTQNFVAVRDLEAGEEVTVSYIDVMSGLGDKRRGVLHEAYGFTCLCERCSEGSLGVDALMGGGASNGHVDEQGILDSLLSFGGELSQSVTSSASRELDITRQTAKDVIRCFYPRFNSTLFNQMIRRTQQQMPIALHTSLPFFSPRTYSTLSVLGNIESATNASSFRLAAASNLVILSHRVLSYGPWHPMTADAWSLLGVSLFNAMVEEENQVEPGKRVWDQKSLDKYGLGAVECLERGLEIHRTLCGAKDSGRVVSEQEKRILSYLEGAVDNLRGQV